MADLTGMLQAAAGAAGGENLYIEDVFSTYLYKGNASTNNIVNGLDLDAEGGMVWIKNRAADNHALFDTERGTGRSLFSNLTNAQSADALTQDLTSFNNNGFSLGANLYASVNGFNENFASWTFRKAPKFFDVVTYTGTGSARTVSHNLGSVPGMIIVKGTDFSDGWRVYHRSLGASKYLTLSSTDSETTNTAYFGGVTPTDTEFTVGTDFSVNGNTKSFVAYLFAHDAGGFGDDGEQNVITCGSVTLNGSGAGTVTLGYEPQWILLKNTAAVENWQITDSLRGMPVGSADALLLPNSSAAESTYDDIDPTATGFNVKGLNANQTYIYIAIRRGPMKTPTAGTEVFSPVAYTGTGSTANMTTGFVADMAISEKRSDPAGYTWDRLRGNFKYLMTYANFTEGTESASVSWDTNNGLNFGSSGYVNQSSINYVHWVFKRAPGFFDVVCYTGTGSATTFNHNLGVVPELMIVRKRSAEDNWAVYFGDNTDFMLLDTDAATSDNNTYWNDTSPTATVFSVGTNSDVNTSAATYVAYLFATLAGISKVGTYTGTGTTLAIDCGFSAGARFVMIKRVDSTGSWFVWDSARGIVSGDDPYIRLDLDSAEVTNTDYVDTSSAGFEITSTAPAAINASGGTFIFLAIA